MFESITGLVADQGLQTVKRIPTTDDIINGLYDDFIVVKPDSGIDGFVFSLLKDTTINADMEFSKHYLESGAIIQDHSIELPITVTLKGFMAEETFKQNQLNQTAGTLDKQLGIVGTYLPNLTNGVQEQFTNLYSQVTKATSYIDGIINNTKSFFSFLDEFSTFETAQQTAYAQLRATQKARKLLTIEVIGGGKKNSSTGLFTKTSSIGLNNMAIKSLNWITRNSETGTTLSDISITLEQIRIVSTTVLKSQIQNTGGKTKSQTNAVKKVNSVKPKASDINKSFLNKFFYGR